MKFSSIVSHLCTAGLGSPYQSPHAGRAAPKHTDPPSRPPASQPAVMPATAWKGPVARTQQLKDAAWCLLMLVNTLRESGRDFWLPTYESIGRDSPPTFARAKTSEKSGNFLKPSVYFLLLLQMSISLSWGLCILTQVPSLSMLSPVLIPLLIEVMFSHIVFYVSTMCTLYMQ